MTRILSITQFLWYSFESISVLRFFGLKASRPVADYIQAAWGYVASALCDRQVDEVDVSS